jgi:hypothetical protein
MKVFLLMEDSDGTTFSQQKPIGIAVTSEEEAKKFVAGSKYDRSYEVIEIRGSFAKNESNIPFYRSQIAELRNLLEICKDDSILTPQLEDRISSFEQRIKDESA